MIDIRFHSPFYGGTSFKIFVDEEEVGGGYWGVTEGRKYIQITINSLTILSSKISFKIGYVKYKKKTVEKFLIKKVKELLNL